ncbi:BatD family protein [Flavobacteriaceae bacterium]|nr:BatD family protein [Flavobacteriaceae bacterium]MDB4006945.1 BatD family protein [Flavobacteriaceae bacterium]MDB4024505.1 BatD family protein [Flavobacteriaceae bacterium]MDB4131521.1 BatD family protein [Flavobacteriaceae bacterium]MDB9827893.1 BatD family protein [Flavobacteriaceae bacterium]
MKLRFYIFLFFAITIISNLNAQDDSISFEAVLSKKSLGINENLRVDFKMNKDGDNFTPPSFKGFTVVGGPNQSVSNMWVNGKRTFSKSYSYFLTPNKKGSLIIGQATIEIDDNIYKTLPVKISVSESVAVSKDPNDPTYVVNENLHLVAEISNTNPYLNEGISIVYKLFYSPQINVTNVGEIEAPEFENFWSQNIKIPRLQIERGSFKGDNYNFVTWKKTVLYPQKSGKLDILPLSLDVSVDVPTNRRDFFGNRIYNQVSKKVTAGKRSINVKALPGNAPESFNGAVGKFDIKLNTNKTELNASESLQAIVKISGKGNLKLFSPPSVQVPNSLEKYDPEYNEKVSTSLAGMKGFISNTYTLVPQFQGKYPIRSVEFTFFNPQLNKYETINSEDIIINVLEGPLSLDENNINTINTQSSNNILPSINQFKFIKTDSDLVKINSKPFIYSLSFYLILIFPVLAILLLVIFFKSNNITSSKLKESKSRRANKLAKKYLSDARKNLENKDMFYVALEKALHNFLKSKLFIETSDYSKEKISKLLYSKDIEKESLELFIKLIENCEFARFTPASEFKINNDYENAVKVITKIDKEI